MFVVYDYYAKLNKEITKEKKRKMIREQTSAKDPGESLSMLG